MFWSGTPLIIRSSKLYLQPLVYISMWWPAVVQPGQRPVTIWLYKLEAANTVWSSWWWAVCRSKHVEPSINFGIISSITRLHLVGYFYWFTRVFISAWQRSPNLVSKQWLQIIFKSGETAKNWTLAPWRPVRDWNWIWSKSSVSEMWTKMSLRAIKCKLKTSLGKYAAGQGGVVHFQVGTNYWQRLYITYR